MIRIMVLESGRASIQAPMASGTALITRKLLNRIAPIRMVKIIDEVRTVSIRQSKKIGQVMVRASSANARAPEAPMPAASSGENMPI